MSAKEFAVRVPEAYRGDTGFYYEHEDVYGVDAREKERGDIAIRDTMMAEATALSIAGILSLVGLGVSLLLSYPLLALLFVMPLVGVAIGFSYIVYMKKHG